ncbi:hypothetical protein PVAND_014615 [Polypedilum vanderplanki]|uniref:Uncharacterized protein n=1 Tax=Polypedilum vanderplanki TaxID=319348 RepID=A0A9J6BA82_POLVA|nr:hypothetical protein PVAND_014615 [Polypedilum vanderplanki]
MKLLAQFPFLSFLFLCIYSKIVTKTNDTLLNFYHFADEIITDNKTPEYSHLANVDRNCVKEKLKIDQNSEKVINERLATALLITVAHLCAKDPEAIYDKEINELPEKVMANLKDKTDCVKFSLKKFEPDDDLIKDFNIDEMKIPKDECIKKLQKTQYWKTNDLPQRDQRLNDLLCRLWNESKNIIFMPGGTDRIFRR